MTTIRRNAFFMGSHPDSLRFVRVETWPEHMPWPTEIMSNGVLFTEERFASYSSGISIRYVSSESNECVWIDKERFYCEI